VYVCVRERVVDWFGYIGFCWQRFLYELNQKREREREIGRDTEDKEREERRGKQENERNKPMHVLNIFLAVSVCVFSLFLFS
jgi:hypothetical protein